MAGRAKSEKPLDVLPWVSPLPAGPHAGPVVEAQVPPQAVARPPAGPTVTAVAGLNPMKPDDLLRMGPAQAAPPLCPHCHMLLHVMQVGANGQDLLFECLTDATVTGVPDPTPTLGTRHPAYQAVWRAPTDTYEPRPFTDARGWLAPLTQAELTKPVKGKKGASPAPPAEALVGCVLVQGKPVVLDGVIHKVVSAGAQWLNVCLYGDHVIVDNPHRCAELQDAFDATQPVAKKTKKATR